MSEKVQPETVAKWHLEFADGFHSESKYGALHRSYAASVRGMMEENERLKSAMQAAVDRGERYAADTKCWHVALNVADPLRHVLAALSGSAPKSEETQDDGR